MVIRRMRVRSSAAIGRRPGLPVRRERRRQYVRQHRSTVSGFTMRREVRQPLNHRHAKIQKRRSASSRRGRGLQRCRTTSCCRRQRLSATRNTFGRIAAAITHRKQRSIHPTSPLSDTEDADATQCCRMRNLPARPSVTGSRGLTVRRCSFAVDQYCFTEWLLPSAEHSPRRMRQLRRIRPPKNDDPPKSECPGGSQERLTLSTS